MHTSLCETFRSLAFRTFDQMGRARRVGHQPLEETFTDTNILELKDRHPAEIFCHTFTKPQEGINGADWEWWITDTSESKWLGLRIQAKVLHLNSNTFAHLHYRSGKSKTYQATKLKREATKDGLIPLYCLYLHESPSSPLSRKRCRTFGHTTESYGCSLVPLAHIEFLQKRGEINDLNSVINGAHPWHCLVCCSGYGGHTLPERACNFLNTGMDIPIPRKSTKREKEIGRLVTGLRDQPPQYVRSIVAGQPPDETPKSMRGVIVVKEAKLGSPSSQVDPRE